MGRPGDREKAIGMSSKDLSGQTSGVEAAKRAAAQAALEFIAAGSLIGVGTGTTASAFIDALQSCTGPRPIAAVASSLETAHLLRAADIEVSPIPPSGRIPLYVDGADEVDGALRMLKGHGGAHTREKVLASAADLFVCIVDDSKTVEALTGRTVPVEYLPMARSFVAREIEKLGGHSVHRPGFVTDNGNELFDVYDLDLSEPGYLEGRLEDIPGVVCCGIFARRGADVLLIGRADGSVETRRAF
jgi:ribose 5-phosphate isomerase A